MAKKFSIKFSLHRPSIMKLNKKLLNKNQLHFTNITITYIRTNVHIHQITFYYTLRITCFVNKMLCDVQIIKKKKNTQNNKR